MGHPGGWILVNGTGYVPGGSLSLGQLLTDPDRPDRPLLPSGGPLPVPPKEIEFSYEKGVKYVDTFSTDSSFSVWFKTTLFPVQNDVGGGYKGNQSIIWKIDKLETQIFTPHTDYLVRTMEKEDTKSYIQQSTFNFRKRLYMITGVRIAKGAQKMENHSRTIDAHTKIGVDATSSGVPVSAGGDSKLSENDSLEESFQSSSDFVYAYRLHRVRYEKNGYARLSSVSESQDSLSKLPASADNSMDYDHIHIDSDDDNSKDSESELDLSKMTVVKGFSDKDYNGIILFGVSDKEYDGNGKLKHVSFGGEDYYLPREKTGTKS